MSNPPVGEKIDKVSNRGIAVLVLLAAFIIALLYISLYWAGIIDDAYIVFRYAQNIHRGYGYVFNIGQPVEGVTSVSWTILLVVFDIFHIPEGLTVKILGILCILMIVYLLWKAFYKSGIPHAIVLFLFSLLLLDKNFILSGMVGLETALYALLLLAITLASKWYAREEGRLPSIVMGGIGVLLFLTRPESIVFLVLIGCGIVFYRWIIHARYPLLPIIIWMVGIALVTTWRWFTFGDFIPNSARDKSLLGYALLHWSILYPRIIAGSVYVQKFLVSSWLIVVIGIVGLVRVRKYFWGIVAFLALCTGVGVVWMNSGDWMPHSRLLTPYLPIVALLAGEGILLLWQNMRGRWHQLFELALVIVAGFITLNTFWSLRNHRFFVASLWPEGECYQDIGLTLRTVLPTRALIAPEAVGRIGYTIMDNHILDFFGLTDPYIAHYGVLPIATYTMGKVHFQYVMQQNPDLFIFHSDIDTHIPWLNHWGYSQEYQTFRVGDAKANCSLLVGIKNSSVSGVLAALQQNFAVAQVDTQSVLPSTVPTWPEGER